MRVRPSHRDWFSPLNEEWCRWSSASRSTPTASSWTERRPGTMLIWLELNFLTNFVLHTTGGFWNYAIPLTPSELLLPHPVHEKRPVNVWTKLYTSLQYFRIYLQTTGYAIKIRLRKKSLTFGTNSVRIYASTFINPMLSFRLGLSPEGPSRKRKRVESEEYTGTFLN